MQTILFVCLGNICRSPALQGVLESLLEKKGLCQKVHVESCAIDTYHIGEDVDLRMKRVALERGYNLCHKAILFQPAFFYIYEYIFAVTKEIKSYLEEIAPNQEVRQKIYLATHFSKHYQDQDIPDPYYLKEAGFEKALDMIEEASMGILDKILF